MNSDFIFCPFCGSSDWITDKTRQYNDEMFISNKCAGCNNFGYAGTKDSLHEIHATMRPYKVVVDYEFEFTGIYALDNSTILYLEQLINFNWYKYEETLDKIKK